MSIPASAPAPLPLPDVAKPAERSRGRRWSRSHLQEITYEHRRSLHATVWAFVLSTLVFQFLPSPTYLHLIAGVLALAVLTAWLWIPAWYGARFRSLAWRMSRGLRRLRAVGSKLASYWFVAAAALILGGWIVSVVYRFGLAINLLDEETLKWAADLAVPFQELLRDESLSAFVLSLLLLAALHAVHQARRRIVILEITNATGDSNLDGACRGIAPRLRNELSSIAHLYRTIDEALPEPGAHLLAGALRGQPGRTVRRRRRP